jgi:hypothetical protein
VKFKKLLLLSSLLLVFSFCAYAHVKLDFPTGGETFEANTQITIRWHIEIDHGPCNWDLYFSSDGGSTWQTIVLDLPKAQLTYDWTVPEIATQQGKIRVVQDNQNTIPYDDYSGLFTIEIPSGNSDEVIQKVNFILFPAYPDPFNPRTKIRYQLSESGRASLVVYDILGNEVETLVNGEKPAGIYEMSFDGSNFAGGVYIYRLTVTPADAGAGEFSAVRKFVLLK